MVSCLLSGIAIYSITGWSLKLQDALVGETPIPMPPPVAIGMLVLSVALMALAHEHSLGEGRIVVRWLPFVVVLAVFSLSFLLWRGIRVTEQKQIRRMLYRATVNVERLVEAEVQARILTLVRVAKRWENRGRRLKADWEFDARLYLSHYPDMQAIEWVDPESIVRWVTPERGNESYLDFDLANDIARRKMLLEARQTREITVTKVHALDNREQGFMVFVPIINQGEFSGFVVGVFRVDPLLRNLLSEVINGFHVKLRQSGRLIFQSGTIEQEVALWSRDGKVSLPQTEWGLEIWPRADTVAELRSPLDMASLLGGSMLALLLGLSIHLAQSAREKERSMATVNRNLADEIRERRQVQNALRENQARFQAILDNTSAVVYLKDVAGRYLLVNVRYEELFHQQKDNMIGRTDSELFPKQMADSFRANDMRVIAEGKALTMEEIAPHDDGLHTYISIKFPLFDRHDKVYAVCGISTDITDRKNAEARLRDSHQALELAHDRLKGILEGTRDPIVALDLKYRFLSFNSAFQREFEN